MSVGNDDMRVVTLPSGSRLIVYQMGGAWYATAPRLGIRTERLLATTPEVARLEGLHLVAEALDKLIADRAAVEAALARKEQT